MPSPRKRKPAKVGKKPASRTAKIHKRRKAKKASVKGCVELVRRVKSEALRKLLVAGLTIRYRTLNSITPADVRPFVNRIVVSNSKSKLVLGYPESPDRKPSELRWDGVDCEEQSGVYSFRMGDIPFAEFTLAKKS